MKQRRLTLCSLVAVGMLNVGSGAATGQVTSPASEPSVETPAPPNEAFELHLRLLRRLRAIEVLHRELALNARQEQRWRAFVTATQTLPPFEPREPPARSTAPERMRRFIRSNEARQALNEQIYDRLSELYRALSPSQRAMFDARFALFADEP